jgi:hypothetical protein
VVNPQLIRTAVQTKSNIKKADTGIELVKDRDALGNVYNINLLEQPNPGCLVT